MERSVSVLFSRLSTINTEMLGNAIPGPDGLTA
jgi:hypothetical protein